MNPSHLSYLLFAFDGRIPRLAYWIGTLIIIAVSIGLYTLLASLLGLTLEEFAKPDPRVTWMSLGVTLLLLYPGLAVMIKRLHDRDRPGWWALVLYLLSMGGDVLDLAGLSGTEEEPSLAFWIWAVPLIVLSLGFLVDLGFLKGTTGDNSYGPDPLGGTPDAKLE